LLTDFVDFHVLVLYPFVFSAAAELSQYNNYDSLIEL